MKRVAGLLILGLLLGGALDVGLASSYNRPSQKEGRLMTGNPQAPELYQAMARLMRQVEQEAIARFIPVLKPTPQGVLERPPAQPGSTPNNI